MSRREWFMTERGAVVPLVSINVEIFNSEAELLHALHRRISQSDRLWFLVEHACTLLSRRWMKVYLFFREHRNKLRRNVADHHVLWHADDFECGTVEGGEFSSSDVVTSDDWERAVDCAVAGGYIDLAAHLYQRWNAWVHMRRVQQRFGNN